MPSDQNSNQPIPLQQPEATPSPSPLTSPPPPSVALPASVGPEEEFRNWMAAKNSPDPTPTTSPPTSTPDTSPAPTPLAPEEDVSKPYAKHRDQGEAAAVNEEFDQLLGSGTARQTATQGANPATTGSEASGGQGSPPFGTETPPKGKKATAAGVLLDVLHGLGQAPSEIQGGVLDAYDGLRTGAEALGKAIYGKLPSGTPYAYDSKSGHFATLEEYNEARKSEPMEKFGSHVPLPTTVTGNMIRGIAQFMTGFLTAGEATGLHGVVGGLVNGAISDAAFFEGHSKNLANLVQEFPKLQNPVTQLLATAPDDSEAEGRFKNVVNGVLGGLAAEGTIQAFAKGLRYLQQAEGANAITKFVQSWQGEKSLPPPNVEPMELRGLGDPGKPAVTKLAEKYAAAEGRTAGIEPSDVQGKLNGAPQDQYAINFAAINTGDDVKNTLQKIATYEKASLEEGKGGVQSNKTTESMADREDAFDVLAERRSGSPLPAHELLAVKKLYVASGEKLSQMADLARKTPTDANLFMFERMAAIHSMVQREFLNAGSEVGRALQILQYPVGSSRQVAEQLQSMLETVSGGREQSLSLANKVGKLAEAGQLGKVDELVTRSLAKRVSDGFAQYYMGALLSPVTTNVKLVSDFGNMFLQMGARQMAGFIHSTLGTEGGVHMGEALAMAHGGLTAFKEGLSALGEKLKIPEFMKDEASGRFAPENVSWNGYKEVLGNMALAPEGAVKELAQRNGGAIPFEIPPTGKLAAENWNIASDYVGRFGIPWGKIADFADVATRVNTRMISTADLFSKMVGYRMELHAQALRQASSEMADRAITRGEYYDRISDIIQRPSSEVNSAAVDQAMYQTFASKPAESLNKIGTALQQFPIIGRILLPFKATPINILTQAVEFTPLAPLIGSWRADLAAGGAKAEIALAKMSTGMALFATAADMAFSGQITGRGPQRPGERANWERLGNQEYSLTLGNQRLSFSRFDPIGFILGFGADYAEAITNAEQHVDDREFIKLLSAGVFTIANNLAAKTYLLGWTQFVNALSQPEGKGVSLLQRTMTSLIPLSSTVGIATRTVDPYARAASGFMDAFYRRTPGLSATLPPQRNLWGEPLNFRSAAGAAYDAFSPYWLKTANPQPIDQELKKLEYYPSMPPRRITLPQGTRIDLDTKQYSRYVDLAGNALKDAAHGNMGCRDYLNSLVTGSSPFSAIYQAIKADDQRMGTNRAKDFVEKTINDYRQLAKMKLFGEDQNLQSSYDEKTAGKPGRIPSSALKLIGQ